MGLRLFLILLGGCLFFAPAKGQTAIQIFNGTDNSPIKDAFIWFKKLSNTRETQHLVFADSSGTAHVTLTGPSLVVIQYPGFERVVDTLPDQTVSKNYYLKELNKVLDQVVVTGQYDQRTADQSPIRISVINAARIEKLAAQNLGQLLANELNIRVANDAFLGSSVSLQGISGQNIKILVDGVPLTGRMNGNVDMSQLMLSNMERIEIIEGPMSVVYGTDALGGVINMITKKEGNKYRPFNINSYYESVGHYNFDARAAINLPSIKIKNIGSPKAESQRLIVSGGRYFFQGFTTDESIRDKPWKPKEQLFGDIQYMFKTGRWQHRLYSQLYHEKLISRGKATINSQEAYAFDDFYFTVRNSNSFFSEVYRKNGSSLALINSFSWYNRQRETYHRNLVTLKDTRVNNTQLQDTNAFYHWMSRGVYSANLMAAKLNYQVGYDINHELGKGRRLHNEKQQITDAALFATAEYKPLVRLLLRPGLRAAWNSRFGIPLLPSIHAKYDLTSYLYARASYARGYRAPSIKELNLEFIDVNHNVEGNSNLRAEQSDNYLASLQLQHKKSNKLYRLDISGFYNHIYDMISLAVQDINTNQYTYINIDEFRSQGALISGEIRSAIYTVSIGMSYIGRNNRFSNGNALPFVYTPEFRSNFTYTIPGIVTDLAVFYKYNGKQLGYALDANNLPIETYISSFSMLDINLGKKLLNNQLYLSAGCKNLLNVVNVNTSVVSSVHGGGNGQLLTGTGRSYFIQMKWNFGVKKI